jgi:hypothetical protein
MSAQKDFRLGNSPSMSVQKDFHFGQQPIRDQFHIVLKSIHKYCYDIEQPSQPYDEMESQKKSRNSPTTRLGCLA